MTLHPQGIKGSWRSGIILDWHTIDSKCIGENEFGHPIFETTRSDIGELLYRFKYKNDKGALKELLSLTCKFLVTTKGQFEVFVPIPSSNPKRTVTKQIARGLAQCLEGQYCDSAITKQGATEELKNVNDPDRRRELLSGVFRAAPEFLNGKIVLLVDDLYRSGATLEAATKVAYEHGHAKAVYVFAVTRTRVNR